MHVQTNICLYQDLTALLCVSQSMNAFWKHECKHPPGAQELVPFKVLCTDLSIMTWKWQYHHTPKKAPGGIFWWCSLHIRAESSITTTTKSCGLILMKLKKKTEIKSMHALLSPSFYRTVSTSKMLETDIIRNYRACNYCFLKSKRLKWKAHRQN